MAMHQALEQAILLLKETFAPLPRVAVVLGSGLGAVADQLEDKKVLFYKDVPGMEVSTAPGHRGAFLCGKLGKTRILALQGRLHYYEGYTMEQVVYPIRLLTQLGIEHLILSNAAGGIRTDFKPGDLMLITDHINWMGTNPLIGKNDLSFGPRFPDMSAVYDKTARKRMKAVAASLSIPLQEGVYIACSGPSYETPAEIRAFRTIGADAVGMSTVPEAIVARHGGMDVLGISCISNMASGILDQPLTEEEVLTTGKLVEADMLRLMEAYLESYEKEYRDETTALR